MELYDTFIPGPLICELQTDSDTSKYHNAGKTEVTPGIFSNLKLWYSLSLLEKVEADKLGQQHAWTFCIKILI